MSSSVRGRTSLGASVTSSAGVIRLALKRASILLLRPEPRPPLGWPPVAPAVTPAGRRPATRPHQVPAATGSAAAGDASAPGVQDAGEPEAGAPRCAGRCRPEVGVPVLVRRLCSVGTALFAALRAAVPTGGRRSLAGASLRVVAWAPVGGAGRHARSVGPRNGVPPPAKTAGTARERRPLVGTRGSAKPAPMTVRRTDVSGAPPAQSGLRCSLRFAQRCRPEVGVPLPVRRLCSIGTAPLAPRRGAVPTGGRRSLACASLRVVNPPLGYSAGAPSRVRSVGRGLRPRRPPQVLRPVAEHLVGVGLNDAPVVGKRRAALPRPVPGVPPPEVQDGPDLGVRPGFETAGQDGLRLLPALREQEGLPEPRFHQTPGARDGSSRSRPRGVRERPRRVRAPPRNRPAPSGC